MHKKGITVAILAVTVIIMMVLATAITVGVSSSLSYARLSTWCTEIAYVQDIVNENLRTSSTTNFLLDQISFDTSSLSSSILTTQFANETISNNTVVLYQIDLDGLKITNTTYGNLKEGLDIYAYSETTNKVYYLKGVDGNKTKYYTLTDELINRYNLGTSSDAHASTIVYRPNITGYTNQPITVSISIPVGYTDITITTSNTNVVVSSQSTVGTNYVYNVNTNNIGTNYDITVKYNDGASNRTETYSVNTFDNTPPTISRLNASNVVYQRTATTANAYLNNLSISDSGSGLKSVKYVDGKVTPSDVKTYFEENGKIVLNRKFKIPYDSGIYTVYAEDYAGNFNTYVYSVYKYNDELSVYIVGEVDTVPIPKGFVASPYAGERTKSQGLVIYELNSGEEQIPTSETKTVSMATRNQYVWVPVSSDEFKTQFLRSNFGTTNSLSNVPGTNYWEAIIDITTNLPVENQNTTYMSRSTITEIKAMYASVQKYGGFYVGRYEAGYDTPLTTTVIDKGIASIKEMQNKYAYNYMRWGSYSSPSNDTGGAVELARSVYSKDPGNKMGVFSTLVYGVQWDRTCQWLLDTNAVSSLSDSSEYGNYINQSITSDQATSGAKLALFSPQQYTLGTYRTFASGKPYGYPCIYTTGATEVNKINNIYDMAGNVYEWTMEGYEETAAVLRGGWYGTEGGYRSITNRYMMGLTVTGCHLGFRLALYIR